MGKIRCVHCKSRDFVRRGMRYNESGKKQVYLCNSCNKKFTPEPRRMRFRQEDVKEAVRLRKNGMSLSEVRKEMKKHGVDVSRWTISLWNKKY